MNHKKPMKITFEEEPNSFRPTVIKWHGHYFGLNSAKVMYFKMLCYLYGEEKATDEIVATFFLEKESDCSATEQSLQAQRA